MSEQLRERQESERKLARLIRQMDHFERARREEEAPLLQVGHLAGSPRSRNQVVG